MDYITAIVALFQCTNFTLSERSKIVNFNFDFGVTLLPKYMQLVELVESFPNRDCVVLTLKNENDDLFVISSSDLSSQQKFDSFKADCEYSEQLSGVILINKSVQGGCISVYNFSNFIHELCLLSLDEILRTFSALLSGVDHLTFEVFDEDVLFKTKTMLFSSAPQKVVFDTFDRKHRLNICSETTHFYDQAQYPLLPDDFQIDINFEDNPLSEIFNKLSNILSLIYLSSFASFNCEILEVRIAGQRTLEFKYQCNLIGVNPELYKIYNWVYTDGNAIDKAMIARNILCLHCRFSDIQKIDGKTFASIQSNYNLYLKENVSQYIQLTNKLAEFISGVVSKTGDYVTSLLDNFKTNLIAIFGFLFTVVLANIVSDNPLDNIFTRDITIILEAVLLGSVIYLIICIFETKYKVKKVRDSYDALKANYSALLTPEDVMQAFDNDKLIIKMVKEVNDGIIKYSLLWGLFILASLAIIEIISTEPFIVSLLQQLLTIIKNIFTLYNT